MIDDGWFIRKPLVLAWASKDLATSAARNLISSSAKVIVVTILVWVEGKVSGRPEVSSESHFSFCRVYNIAAAGRWGGGGLSG